MENKIVRVIEAMSNETVRIRWFDSGEGGYYEEEHTCPPLEVRKERNENKRISGSGSENSSS